MRQFPIDFTLFYLQIWNFRARPASNRTNPAVHYNFVGETVMEWVKNRHTDSVYSTAFDQLNFRKIAGNRNRGPHTTTLKYWNRCRTSRKIQKNARSLRVPDWSPTSVLTELNVAWLRWSDEKRYFQRDMNLACKTMWFLGIISCNHENSRHGRHASLTVVPALCFFE